MTPERWHQLKTLFRSVLECEPSQRAALLETACAGDPSLRAEIESLLVYHEQAGSFIDLPAVEVAPELLSYPEVETAGRRIGPYRVIREIGHGGMGSVYLAERADETYRKRVAIKLIKPGMDTQAIRQRFHQERQILADLDHPNIARLIDGGATEDGLSYFVMDYVEGLPMDVYCATHQLSTEARLTLFRTVCSAVQYAHEHHVIHRDLKPGNVLVTAEGVPKLLDFGIAKLFDPERSGQTMASTLMGLRPMTPEYASPEQVRGKTITPASDVYSLGVLLYELLTGHRPYCIQSSTPQEVERVICEAEPEKLSAVIRRYEEGRANGTVGPDQKILVGDLDNIVLMALRKEPERRYASVAALSEDIGRHLERQPVIARPDTLR